MLLALIVAFSIGSPYFLTRANWLNTSSTATEVLLLAVGETFVICAGGIDLSVGAVLGFSGTAGAWVMTQLISGPPAGSAVGAVALGFAAAVAGGAFGLVNGFLVAWAGIPPFVVTLGTLGIATGFGYLLNNGQEISAIPGSVATFGNTNLGGWVPVPVLITAVITIWCGLLLAKTRFGAYTLSIGDSREAVVRAGINDRRYLLEIYTLSGVLAGVAAVLVMARLGAGSPDSGATDNLNAIAAVVIGGASLFGGRGTIIGSVIGTGIIAVLLTGLVLINVPPFWQEVAVGACSSSPSTSTSSATADKQEITRARGRNQCLAREQDACGRSRPSSPWSPSARPRALPHRRLVVIAGIGVRGRDRERSASASAAASAKHYTIAYVPGATGVAFYDTLVAGMKAKAAALGMSVTYQGSPNFAPASQTPIVDAICTEHPSALIVSPTDPVAMAPAINTCLNAGIPVITWTPG